jgi:hypothetical protein
MDVNISNRFEKLREGVVDANENNDAEEQSASHSSSKRVNVDPEPMARSFRHTT